MNTVDEVKEFRHTIASSAQVEEHGPKRRRKARTWSGSHGFRPPRRGWHQAGIAQLVERNLAKVEVASSSLVSRSSLIRAPVGALFFSRAGKRGAVGPDGPGAAGKTCFLA